MGAAGAGGAWTVIWSSTFVTPAVCVAILYASSRAASLVTVPEIVTTPLLDVTCSDESFSCGSENIRDLMFVTIPASLGAFEHPAKTIIAPSIAIETTDLVRIPFLPNFQVIQFAGATALPHHIIFSQRTTMRATSQKVPISGGENSKPLRKRHFSLLSLSSFCRHFLTQLFRGSRVPLAAPEQGFRPAEFLATS